MTSVAVFPNTGKEHADDVLKSVIDFFKMKGAEIYLPQNEALYFGYEDLGTENIKDVDVDFAVSIGGDGTLLGVCRELYGRDIPVTGINIGTFGFLPDVEVNEIEGKLQMMLDHKYHIEDRLILEASVRSENGTHFLGRAVNDVVVTKGGVARMLQLGLSVNGYMVSEYRADGLIVSTATGSTAYSLSAGGPIVTPKVKAIILTPICPHTFTIRPMVIDENDEVVVHIAAVHQDIIVTFDGQESFRLLPGDKIIVRKAEHQAHIVKFDDKDYYQTILGKLWK